MSTEWDQDQIHKTGGVPFETIYTPFYVQGERFEGTWTAVTHGPTPKRGPKKPGRHQWHQVRPGCRPKHRRTQGPPGVVICLRRGCKAVKLRSGYVVGPATCEWLRP